MNLTEEQIERYSRQIILPDIGGTGQEKLLKGKVLVIGAGGLGSPVDLYLAAAGVGTIGIMDGDAVDLSNLQRQILHTTDDVGVQKVESAKQVMNQINPDVDVIVYNERFNADNGPDILKDYDFVVDGTDSFASKFLVADACHFAGKPYNHAGILGFSGQMMTVRPGETACYRCVFREPPPPGSVPTCSQAGVLGAVAGVIGTLQANEVVKFLTGVGAPLYDKMLVFDALESSFRTVKLSKSDSCPLCGQNPSIKELKLSEDPTQACRLQD